MAYNVSEEFHRKCYSGESLYKCKLYINNELVPVSQIQSIDIDSPIIDNTNENNGIFYIGTFIAQTITIHFKNLDGLNIVSGNDVSLTIGQIVNNELIDVPIGQYLIDDLDENYQKTCQIKCMDYSVKFSQAVDYSSAFVDGKIKIDSLLIWLCNYFDVELGDYPSINGDVEIGTYDSTISGKRWISYIAEIKGCNAKMNRYGALVLVPFKSPPVTTINALSSKSFELGEKFKLSKVVYFDAIRNFTYGDDTGNTIYIRQDNPFITDSEVVENIYETVAYDIADETGTNVTIENSVAGDIELTVMGNLTKNIKEVPIYYNDIPVYRNDLPLTYKATNKLNFVTRTQTINIYNQDKSESQTYQIRLGGIELYSNGDIYDYIYKNKLANEWYIKKNIYNYKIYRIANFTVEELGGGLYRFKTGGSSNINENYPILSDIFDGVLYDEANIKDNTIYSHLGYIYIVTSNFTTADELKEFINGNPLNIYGVRKTPLDTKITNSNLINDLEELQNAQSYDFTTYIETTGAVINAHYYLENPLEIYSLTCENRADISLDAWDHITYQVGDNTYETINNNSLTYAMTIMGKNEVKIPTKHQEVTTNVKEGNDEVKFRRIRTDIDNVNARVDIVVEEQGETEDKVTQLTTDLNGLTTTVSTVQQATETAQSTADSAITKADTAQSGVNNLNQNAISSVLVYYALGDSQTTAPSSGWSTTAPEWQENKYIWQKTTTTYVNGTVVDSAITCIQGAKGEDGQDGSSGVGISSIVEYYATSTSSSTIPTDFSTTVPTMDEINKFLWNYERINYTNNTHKDTSKRVIGAYGEQGIQGESGVGISNIENKYLATSQSSGVTKSTSGWTSEIQSVTTTNKYLWNYEIITYTNNTTYESEPIIIGVYGDTGQQGNTGKGVKALTAQYYLSTSNTSTSGGSWKDTQDTWESGKYIWTRTKIDWTDNTTSYTTPILAEDVNNANETAHTANSTANTANTTANSALSTAESAESTAQQASDTANNASELAQNTDEYARNNVATFNEQFSDILEKFDGYATTDMLTTLETRVQQIVTDTYTRTDIDKIISGTDVSGKSVSYIQTTSGTFDENGMHYSKTNADTSSTINEIGLDVTDKNNDSILFAGYRDNEAKVEATSIYLKRYLGLSDWRIEETTIPTSETEKINKLGGVGIGYFYLG